ncbi:hypothetical protein DM02DRAFT_519378 [Periconia macrospinosa]|uniref:Uncharacterized protein n=1 Tax=Periconia macrospinosa TaxID=97972 RepID=A0A2V1E1P4_9PLEO|nr:hypothetical protein DM02DRAFT_519378 [Periconia macrospinosa]
MCDYTKVQFKCSHLRYIVRAWCTKYQQTHTRCPVNVVAVEYRLDEYCGWHPQKNHFINQPVSDCNKGDCKNSRSSTRRQSTHPHFQL